MPYFTSLNTVSDEEFSDTWKRNQETLKRVGQRSAKVEQPKAKKPFEMKLPTGGSTIAEIQEVLDFVKKNYGRNHKIVITTKD